MCKTSLHAFILILRMKIAKVGVSILLYCVFPLSLKPSSIAVSTFLAPTHTITLPFLSSHTHFL